MALSKEQIEIIKGDFPPESVQVKKGFKDAETGNYKYLTGYKPQYVFERLNEAFGHDGWDYKVIEKGIEGKEVWCWGRLSIYKVLEDTPEGTFSRVLMSSVDQFGTGSYNKGTTIGDGMKSAATNALEKCASLKDIGHLAYKGLVDVPESHPDSSGIKETKTQASRTALSKELGVVCKKYKIDKASFPTLTKKVLDKEIASSELATVSLEGIQKLIDHVKKHKGPF